MTQRYAILLLPSVNRVYSAAAQHMAIAELLAFETGFAAQLTELQSTTIAGVPYITFSTSKLSTQDISALSNLSCLYALFEINENDAGIQLTPITRTPLDLYPSDLLSILKFAGKTNEQFTKLLINLSLLASHGSSGVFDQANSENSVRVLDPLCGRGTTLNQALMYGFDASGIEIDKRDYDAYGLFINRWLKDNRLKHESRSVTYKQHKETQAQRHQIKLAHSKEAFKKNDVQHLDFVLGDTLQSCEYFKKNSFDLIIADLPYGIKHGSHSAQGTTRSPLQLLEQAVPAWTKLLRKGGAMGLAWNTHLASKKDVMAVLENAGLSIYAPTMAKDFRHRVDQAIMRDILVAMR